MQVDLDQPVADALDGDVLAVSVPAEPVVVPAERRAEHKKSIRTVAAEHSRSNHHNPTTPKRTAKLWKRPVEDVEIAQDQAQGQLPSTGADHVVPSVKRT